MHHELKIKDCYYQAIMEKRKTCELRYNDRDYQTDDTISFIVLNEPKITEAAPEGYVYRPPTWKITHVLQCSSVMQDFDGYVVLSLKKI